MTVTIEIPDDRADAYRKRAEAQGLTLEEWLLKIADQNGPPRGSIAHLQQTDPQEWIRQFREWVNDPNRKVPVLSDEAMSRESIY